jgi:hypothetical protein
VRFEADGLQFALRRLVRPGSAAAVDSAWTSADDEVFVSWDIASAIVLEE